MSRRPLASPMGSIIRRDKRMLPGGRMWSESPVQSRTRTFSAGGETSSVLEPVSITPNYIYNTNLTLVGGGGQDTLRDGGDSTYVLCYAYQSPFTYGYAAFTLEGATIPTSATITSAQLGIRARISATSAVLPTLGVYLVGDPFDTFTPEWLGYADPQSEIAPPDLTSTFTEFAIPSSGWGILPTVAEFNAGLTGFFEIGYAPEQPAGDTAVDVSELWVWVQYT